MNFDHLKNPFEASEDDLQEMIDNAFSAYKTLCKKFNMKASDDDYDELSYKVRLLSLDDAQLEHLFCSSLLISPECEERLDKCKTEDQRNRVLDEYARSAYMKLCEWSDYLRGATDKPPVGEMNDMETILDQRLDIIEKFIEHGLEQV